MPTVTTKMRAVWNSRNFDIEEVRPILPPHHINAGELRDRIALQALTETRDAHGGVTKTFSTTDTVWGRVKFLKGREFFEAEQVQSDQLVEIKIREQILICRERHQGGGWRG